MSDKIAEELQEFLKFKENFEFEFKEIIEKDGIFYLKKALYQTFYNQRPAVNQHKQ